MSVERLFAKFQASRIPNVLKLSNDNPQMEGDVLMLQCSSEESQDPEDNITLDDPFNLQAYLNKK